MKKYSDKPTKAVATPKFKTTTHEVIKAKYGHNVGDKVELTDKSVRFYRKNKVIK